MRIFLDFCILLFLFFFGRIFYASIDGLFLVLGSGILYVVPYLFWFIIVFLALYIFLPKKGLNNDIKLGFFFVILCTGYISLEFVSWIKRVGQIELVEKNYIGFTGLDEKEEFDTEEGEVVSYLAETKRYVFIKKDRQIAYEISRIESQFNSGYRTNDFIFWQTALMSGFDAKYITEYHCCEHISDEVALYFNAGLLVITESFIEAIIDALLFLVFPFVLRLGGKYIFFEDFESLKKRIVNDEYRRPYHKDYYD